MDRETAEDIKRHFDATAGGLRGEIVALRADIVAVDEKLDRRFEELNATTGGLRGEIVAVDEKLDRRFEELNATTGGLRGEIVAVDEKLDRRFEELKRHFEVVGEALRSDIRTVAEGFVATNDRLDRFQVKVSDRFGEMETMLRLSFGELARRIQ
jgi:preprotein translocase subunit YajC